MFSEVLRDLFTSGKGVMRLAASRAFATGVWSALPTASIDFRGALARTEGSTGNADRLRFARKTAADAYEWGIVPVPGTDPGADRLVFWDESLGDFTYGTTGTGLAFSGTTLGLDADLVTIAGLSDPNADRILFWDDSAGAYAYLAPDATDLAISGTTLSIGSAPSFSDFTNATHTHQSAATGGAITAGASTSLTIASGAVTLPSVLTTTGLLEVILDTEGGAASDDLDTINITGTVNWPLELLLRTTAGTRDVVVKHGTGNIFLGTLADHTLTSKNVRARLYRSGSNWFESAARSG